jgi:hypothetical protein
MVVLDIHGLVVERGGQECPPHTSRFGAYTNATEATAS